MHGPAERRTATGGRRGVTLVELLVVMAIVGLMLGIAYPSFVSGLDGIRLKTAADRAGSFWAQARQHADRRQTVVQVTVDPKNGELRAVAAEGGWRETLALDGNLAIVGGQEPRTYWIYPGTPSPKFEVLLEAGDGGRAGAKVNVLTGVAEPWDGE